MIQDISHLLERLEIFEERSGVSLEGLYAILNDQSRVVVRGELHVRDGLVLAQNLIVNCVVYDHSGRVVGTENHYVLKDKFYGFEPFTIFVDTHSVMPVKIRIFPQIW